MKILRSSVSDLCSPNKVIWVSSLNDGSVNRVMIFGITSEFMSCNVMVRLGAL